MSALFQRQPNRAMVSEAMRTLHRFVRRGQAAQAAADAALLESVIKKVAQEVARRFIAVHMRPEGRLNDDYLAETIERIVVEVLSERDGLR